MAAQVLGLKSYFYFLTDSNRALAAPYLIQPGWFITNVRTPFLPFAYKVKGSLGTGVIEAPYDIVPTNGRGFPYGFAVGPDR